MPFRVLTGFHRNQEISSTQSSCVKSSRGGLDSHQTESFVKQDKVTMLSQLEFTFMTDNAAKALVCDDHREHPSTMNRDCSFDWRHCRFLASFGSEQDNLKMK
jgi:hypothetical protein